MTEDEIARALELALLRVAIFFLVVFLGVRGVLYLLHG